MRLARVELKNVGPFEDTVFELPEPKGPGELVLFEGPNGSGKTTVLQVVAMAAAAGGNVDALGAPFHELLKRGRSNSPSAEVTIEHASESTTIACAQATPQLDRATHGTTIAAWMEKFAGASMSRDATPWAAFAFRGHVPTAGLTTQGPKEISAHPLQGALSFGTDTRVSSNLGQLLINLEYDRVQAKLYASERADAAAREGMEGVAASRARSIARFAQVLSRVLDRRVEIEFGIGVRTPRLLFDGEHIPIEVLGEGFRNTVSWLGDLFVRLERTSWASPELSPLEQDFWLLLDEVEESLHPTMQARILPAIRELFPNAHIYATTHSPFVVASVGEGTIFAIRPDADHKVRGEVKPRALEHGQSLEFVTSSIFQAPHGFVDEPTREALEAHDRDVLSIARKAPIDWPAFLARRRWLMGLNEEVSTVVALQEVRVRAEIQQHVRAQSEPAGPEAGA